MAAAGVGRLAPALLPEPIMIAFAAGLVLGSTFGVCLMGALWARQREEQALQSSLPTPVESLPLMPFSRRPARRAERRPALAH